MGTQQSQTSQPKLSDWSMPEDDPPINSRTPSRTSNKSTIHPDNIVTVVINQAEQQDDDDDSYYQRDDKYSSINS